MRVIVTGGFDETTDAGLRDAWQRVAEAGLPKAIEQRHPPHFTIAVLEINNLDSLPDALVDIAASTPAPEVDWRYVGVFPAVGAVFLGPAVSADLLNLHAAIHRARAHAGLPTTEHPELLLPGRWVPHASLHVGLTDKELDPAVRAASGCLPLPRGWVTRLMILSPDDPEELWTTAALNRQP